MRQNLIRGDYFVGSRNFTLRSKGPQQFGKVDFCSTPTIVPERRTVRQILVAGVIGPADRQEPVREWRFTRSEREAGF